MREIRVIEVGVGFYNCHFERSEAESRNLSLFVPGEQLQKSKRCLDFARHDKTYHSIIVLAQVKPPPNTTINT